MKTIIGATTRRGRGLLLVGLVAASLAATVSLGAPADAQETAPRAQSLPGGNTDGSPFSQSSVVSDLSGLCLDVPNVSRAPGVQLAQWACNGGDNQHFSYRSTVTQQYGRKLSVYDESGSPLCLSGTAAGNGAAVITIDCGHADNWDLWPNGNLYDYDKGTCANVAGGSRSNGAPIILFTCSTDAGTVWNASVPVGGFTHAEFAPVLKTNYLVTAGSGSSPQVTLSDVDVAASHWTFLWEGTQTRIRNDQTGTCITATDITAPLVLRPCTDDYNQLWTIKQTGSQGYYEIFGSGQLNVYNGTLSAGKSTVGTWSGSGDNNALWRFVPVVRG